MHKYSIIVLPIIVALAFCPLRYTKAQDEQGIVPFVRMMVGPGAGGSVQESQKTRSASQDPLRRIHEYNAEILRLHASGKTDNEIDNRLRSHETAAGTGSIAGKMGTFLYAFQGRNQHGMAFDRDDIVLRPG